VNVVAWVGEPGWEQVVDAVAALGDARVTLLHVLPGDVIDGPAGARAGLLGRHRDHRLEERLSALTAEGAEALLEAAAQRLGGPAERVVRTGRPEREVLDAAAGCDVLVLSRESTAPGPRSIGHAARFVVDHAPCRVLLVWPGS
jgi:nucleotide-binding universal stress UspA family protein